ncbi:hypothetical protein [Desulfococcus multivorans]|nr:hypothetical protein [Desulfococcus multivorans]
MKKITELRIDLAEEEQGELECITLGKILLTGLRRLQHERVGALPKP